MTDIPKRRLLKAAQTQLNMCQEDYVAMLIRVTGKHSSTLLGKAEINDVLNEFKRLGFKSTSMRDKYIRYISYLWIQLGEAGILDNPSKAAMHSFCQRTCKQGVYKADIKQLNAIIESLKAWCERTNVEIRSN